MESIYEYVTSTRSAAALEPAGEVPHERVDDYVNTMRQSCEEGKGAFKWPSHKFGFMRALAVALHHLPVGHMVTIKNAPPIPRKLYDKYGNLDWHASDLYHGTSATLVPRIMGQGLLPTIGAGSQHLKEQYRAVHTRSVRRQRLEGWEPVSDPPNV